MMDCGQPNLLCACFFFQTAVPSELVSGSGGDRMQVLESRFNMLAARLSILEDVLLRKQGLE